MKQVLGLKLTRQAKFWLDAGDKNGRFLWVWFVPIGDVVAVVEEMWEKGGNSSYRVLWWDIKDLENLLEEYFYGAIKFKDYRLECLAAVERNFTEEERQKAKEWRQIRRRLEKGEKSPELFSAYYWGIKRGYYLFACI